MDLADTIVAPITPPGRGAIAVIRLSGDKAHEIARSICPDAGAEPRHAYYGKICGEHVIDDGICTLFAVNSSYTGEEVAEISCHGSPEIVRQILEVAKGFGARFARPGEFTERAFLNGKFDLSQAEAVRETVDSETEAQARRAALLRSGALFERVQEIEMLVGRALAHIEAVVDFSDEVGELDRESVRADLRSAAGGLDGLLQGALPARLIRNGLRIALVGRPNVGKSSLLNAILGTNRAIVTNSPGTTRDTIEEMVSVGGYPVVLTDTAGLRSTDDVAEAEGVARSREAVRHADEVWFVFEAHVGLTSDDLALADSLGRETTRVANKSDLGVFQGDAIRVSAVTEGGVDPLRDRIISIFETGHETPLANERHAAEFDAAKTAIGRAAETLANPSLPYDLACVDLYAALDHLGRVTGRTAPDEIIQRVFADFCIGK